MKNFFYKLMLFNEILICIIIFQMFSTELINAVKEMCKGGKNRRKLECIWVFQSQVFSGFYETPEKQ